MKKMITLAVACAIVSCLHKKKNTQAEIHKQEVEIMRKLLQDNHPARVNIETQEDALVFECKMPYKGKEILLNIITTSRDTIGIFEVTEMKSVTTKDAKTLLPIIQQRHR